MLLPMTTPSRPPLRRTPRALEPRRGRRGLWLAGLVGVLAAVVLVGVWMPVDTGEAVSIRSGPDVVQPVAPRRTATPATPMPSPRPVPPGQPTSDPPEVEGPVDERRQWFKVVVVDTTGAPTEGGLMPVACAGFDYDPSLQLHSAFAPGECTIEAVRRDGALFRRSEAKTLRLEPGAPPQRVELVLPAERTGGIGVRFLPTRSGMRVVSLVEGGPAWEAGLEIGDVIITVDGEAVDGLDQQEFVRRMTGPEGSAVEFEILYADEASAGAEGPVVEQVRVERRYLDG